MREPADRSGRTSVEPPGGHASDETGTFEAGPDLGRAAARSGAATMAGQIGQMVVQGIGIVVLARLLTPTDYGRMALVVVITTFGALVRDFGLGNAVTRAPVLTRQQRDNLLWINTALGIVLAAALFLGAGAIADVYDDPALEGIAQALAGLFVIRGFVAQYRAGLSRDLRFGVLAVTAVAAAVLALAVAVVMAAAGAGYWALVGMEVTRTVAESAGIAAAARWWPGLYTRGAKVGGFVRFGWHVLASQFLTFLSGNVDTVLIGLRFGPSAVGLYNRAFQIMLLPVRQLSIPATKVALPVLGRLVDDQGRFIRYVVRGQGTLLHLVVPPVAIACAFAGPLVAVVLGPDWAPSAPLLRILTVGGLFEAASFAWSWIFQATGVSRELLRLSLVTRPLVVVAIVVGAAWGVQGVAAGYAIGTALGWPIGMWWVSRTTDVAVGGLVANFLRIVTGYGVSAVCGLVVVAVAHPTHPAAQLLLGGAVFLVAVAVLVLVWTTWRRDLGWAVETMRLAVRRRPAELQPTPDV